MISTWRTCWTPSVSEWYPTISTCFLSHFTRLYRVVDTLEEHDKEVLKYPQKNTLLGSIGQNNQTKRPQNPQKNLTQRPVQCPDRIHLRLHQLLSPASRSPNPTNSTAPIRLSAPSRTGFMMLRNTWNLPRSLLRPKPSGPAPSLRKKRKRGIGIPTPKSAPFRPSTSFLRLSKSST